MLKHVQKNIQEKKCWKYLSNVHVFFLWIIKIKRGEETTNQETMWNQKTAEEKTRKEKEQNKPLEREKEIKKKPKETIVNQLKPSEKRAKTKCKHKMKTGGWKPPYAGYSALIITRR